MLYTVCAVLLVSVVRCEPATSRPKVSVNKCCEPDELFMHNVCRHINDTDTTAWRPLFTDEDGITNKPVDFELVIGEPDCGSLQQWLVLNNPLDRLVLLPSGKLRHYAYKTLPNNDYDMNGIETDNTLFHDYEPGKYCLDKNLNKEQNSMSQFAKVCAPETVTNWHNTDFLITKIVDPIFHGTSIICFLIVAVVYFIMPTLRDLVGNIVTTISVCMIVSQAAAMVRIFTEFNSHVSFMIADIVCYTSLLGAFFWLNSLGYYVWKTFKSRNVFLRVTDGKKYCYYSSYAWSCTLAMGAVAVLAHFVLEIRRPGAAHGQEELGSLGMAVFFTPVACTVLADIFFYARTARTIGQMDTYGRIHHKLKHSFRMFVLVFMTMTVAWLFMLLSWLRFDALVYCHVIVNALHAPAFLYACLLDQPHVAFLLRRTCCRADCACARCRPEPDCDWGDEMTAMNTGAY